MNMQVHYSSASNEWETPPELFAYFNKHIGFNLDAAASLENTLCGSYFTKEDNALVQDWAYYQTVWCNPPYGREVAKFVKKGYEESRKSDDIVVAMLVPARTDTQWFQSYCSEGHVYFLKGRLKFLRGGVPKHPAPFPSAVVVFNQNRGKATTYLDWRNTQ